MILIWKAGLSMMIFRENKNIILLCFVSYWVCKRCLFSQSLAWYRYWYYDVKGSMNTAFPFESRRNCTGCDCKSHDTRQLLFLVCLFASTGFMAFSTRCIKALLKALTCSERFSERSQRFHLNRRKFYWLRS